MAASGSSAETPDCLKTSPGNPKQKQHRTTTYRQKLKKEDPEAYKTYLKKQNELVKKNRETLKRDLKKKNPTRAAIEKKKIQLQCHRESQRRYTEKKKKDSDPQDIGKRLLKVCSAKSSGKTRNSIKSKKEYDREMKRKERTNMSYQKKMWIRKKDRERKAEKRQSLKTSLPKEVEVTTTCNLPIEVPEKKFKTKKSEWNITSKDCLKTSPGNPKQKQHRTTTYRQKLKKEDPEAYKTYLKKQNELVKKNRETLKRDLKKKNPTRAAIEKKKIQLQCHRESQRRYTEKKKKDSDPQDIGKRLLKVCSAKSSGKTRNSIKSKKEYDREMKRKERTNMSYQKKMWIRKKDRERKAEKRQSLKTSLPKEVEVTTTCNLPIEVPEKKFKTKKSEWNITSKDCLKTSPGNPKQKQHRTTTYRQKLKKEDPEAYKTYLKKQNELVKKNRETLKRDLKKKNPTRAAIEKKKIQLQCHRESQRRYTEKKKKDSDPQDIGKRLLKVCSAKSSGKTRNSIKSKKEYDREMKRKERTNMSYQKKMWIRKKDRERKAEKRQSLKTSLPKEVEVTTTCNLPIEVPEKKFKTKKSEWNITSKVRSALPTTPIKFAKVINNIITRTTPRKRKELHNLLENNCGKMSKSFIQSLKSVSKKQSLLQRNAKAISLRLLKKSRNYLTGNKKKSLSSRIPVQLIHCFYEREDISRVLPQRRYATTDGPGFAMQVSIKAAHSKFLAENPNKYVSLGKFAALRKRNVRKLNTISHREYCLCVYCSNIKFKLLTLSREVAVKNKKKTDENDIFGILLCPKPDSERFFNPDCINSSCTQCSNSGLYNKKIQPLVQDK